ncbi:MAG: hypothetical protein R3B70_38770 [Polyangiaceae bacterium]
MGLSEVLKDDAKKSAIVADCCTLIDEEVGAKGGLSGIAVKAGYAAVKGIKPGFVKHTVEALLPEFAEKIDPIWEDAQKTGSPGSYLVSNKSRVADALLAVTDARAARSNKGTVKSAYEKLRGSAKKHVEEAVPRLSRVLEKHLK